MIRFHIAALADPPVSSFGLCRVIQSCFASAVAVKLILFQHEVSDQLAQGQAEDRVMGCGKISRDKVGGIFSLKALALALFLTPATVVVPPLATPAVAQIGFYIPIPGIGFGGGGYRHYRGGGGSRHHTSGRHRHHGGGDESEASSAPSAPSSPGKGVRGTSD
jgi:hypothetical protein